MENLQVLQIETTNICNADCAFCPHYRIKKHGIMSDVLYQKILDEAAQLPNLKAFIPVLTGEPLCDPKIVERVQKARRKLPNVEIRFYTNGSLLTEEILDAFKTIDRFYFTVSLNAYSADTRKRLMKLDDFEHVVHMIHHAYEIGIATQVSMMDHPDISDEEKRLFKRYGGIVMKYDNWLGLQFEHERPEGLLPCRRALHHMPIRWDGKVLLCCYDPLCLKDGNFFGDINKQTIQEAWMSEKRQEYVELHRMGYGNDLIFCETCTHDVKEDTEDTIDDYHECRAEVR